MSAMRHDGEGSPVHDRVTQPLNADAFRILQLHPAAPRDLIEMAYWALTGEKNPAPNESRINELNAAYAALLQAPGDGSHAAVQHPTAPAAKRGSRMRLFVRQEHQPATVVDPYALLCVDRDADQRMLAVAYDYWMKSIQRKKVDRSAIEQAYRALASGTAPERLAVPAPVVSAVETTTEERPTDAMPAATTPTPTGPKRARYLPLPALPIRAMLRKPADEEPDAPAPAETEAESETVVASQAPAEDASDQVSAAPASAVQHEELRPTERQRPAVIAIVPARKKRLNAKQAEQAAVDEAESERIRRLRADAEAMLAMETAEKPAQVVTATNAGGLEGSASETPEVELAEAKLPDQEATEEAGRESDDVAIDEQPAQPAIWTATISSAPDANEAGSWEELRRSWYAQHTPVAETGAAIEAATETAQDPAQTTSRRLLPRLFGRSRTASTNGHKPKSVSGEDRLQSLHIDADPVVSTVPALEADAPASASRLRITGGPLAGESFDLTSEPCDIGTDEAATIRLPDDGSIAPVHARIWRRGDAFAFKEVEGSGTTIGGQPPAVAIVLLDDRDEIEIGSHKIQIELGAMPVAAASSAGKDSTS